MKRNVIALLIMVCACFLFAGCGNAGNKNSVNDFTNEVNEIIEANEISETDENDETGDDAIAQAMKMEQDSKALIEEEDAKIAKENETAQENNDEDNKVVEEATPEISLALPGQYALPYEGEKGTVEKISYLAKDYIGNGEDYEKKAYVYLPAGYDESKQYNVLYLMHGIGGNEKEWGLDSNTSKLKRILDHLFGSGAVEPFIVVTPNGKAFALEHEQENDLFYLYGYELRNDLIPYIEGHFSTYANYDENGYDLTEARRHRAIAGLSMGGMQTINVGICECLDVFSYFGAFSAAPTSNNKSVVAKSISDSEYDVDYFYNICGTQDTIAYASAVAAAKDLPDICDKMVDGENYMWQEKPGGHDFNIWYLGIYNFAQLVFTK